VLNAIKNLASKAGYAPPSAKQISGLLANHGRLLAVTEFENDKRAALGLPPVQERGSDYTAILGITPEAKPAGEDA